MTALTLACLSLLPVAIGAFQRLHADHAEATSHLRSNWNKYEENYHPNYALDDDPKTAWVEGVDGDGVGQTLTIPVSALKNARAVRVVVFNGYQKSTALLEANGAPSALTVVVRGPGGRESARREWTLTRSKGPQTLELPVAAGVSEVALTVAGVHAGRKYQDTCISDVQILVDSDVPYSAAVENGKRAALLAWKKERVDLARYYAKLPPTYPYAAARLDLTAEARKVLQKRWQSTTDVDKDGMPEKGVETPGYRPLKQRVAAGELPAAFSDDERALLKELVQLSTRRPDDGRWYSLTMKQKTTPPEGFPLPRELDPLFHFHDATLFEAKGPGSTKPVPKRKRNEDWLEATAVSNVLLLDGTATEPRKLYLTFTSLTVDRASSSQTIHLLVTLQDGHASTVAMWQSTEEDWGYHFTSVAVWKVGVSGGKVSRLDSVAVQHGGSSIPDDPPNPDEGDEEVRTSYAAPAST
ncbi:MAG: hypothetical protein AB2A00_03720 [Myxococcota bacterium]